VFIALCLKLLPNGLIGVFLAAMLAATMSTLSSVYNMVSSILSRDIYQGWIRPSTTDEQLLNVGRMFSVGIGLIVVILAVIFVTSEFGIFNLMQAFFTLLNIPVVVPVTLGLLYRKAPKWAAVGSIVWGLLIGITTRYGLGWDIGPQVYLAFVSCAAIFLVSDRLGTLYAKRKGWVALLAAGVAVLYAAIFLLNLGDGAELWQGIAGAVGAVLLGASLYGFSALFMADTAKDKEVVADFFKKLDTPVDVVREVFGAGRKQVSTFPLVGGTTIVMGLLMSMILFTEMSGDERNALTAIIAILLGFGGLMWYFGKKSEIRSAEQFQKKIDHTAHGS
jgi:hypothetical protein